MFFYWFSVSLIKDRLVTTKPNLTSSSQVAIKLIQKLIENFRKMYVGNQIKMPCLHACEAADMHQVQKWWEEGGWLSFCTTLIILRIFFFSPMMDEGPSKLIKSRTCCTCLLWVQLISFLAISAKVHALIHEMQMQWVCVCARARAKKGSRATHAGQATNMP